MIRTKPVDAPIAVMSVLWLKARFEFLSLCLPGAPSLRFLQGREPDCR
jgi:hypothetical protein